MHNDIKCEFADEKPVKPPVAVCIKRKLTAADNIGILLFAIPEAQRLLATLAEVRWRKYSVVGGFGSDLNHSQGDAKSATRKQDTEE